MSPLMGNADDDELYDEDNELYDEEDDGLADDMEALKQACMLTGTDFNDLDRTSPSASASSGGVAHNSYSIGGDVGMSSDSEGEDDFQLLQSIQNRVSVTADSYNPLSLKPLCALPPVSDDEEDDFETLCAVRRRFAAYDRDNTLRKQTEDPSKLAKPILEPTLASDDILSGAEEDASLFNSLYCDVKLQNSVPEPKNQSNECNPLSALALNYSSFPKSAQLFIDAIKRNRSCQKFLRSKLTQVEARIEENKKLRQRVKVLKDFQTSCRKVTGLQLAPRRDPRITLIAARREINSKDSDKKCSAIFEGPFENSHVANYRMALTKFPLSWKKKNWTKEERENLAKGIRQQFQEMIFQLSLDHFSGAEGFPGDSKNLDGVLTSIRDLEITPERIREFLPKVNWGQLASLYVVGRSGAECEARWLNFEDPLINWKPWTVEEDKKLLFIVQEKGIRNWIDIAVSLGTNRTPSSCLKRFQRSLNPEILKREWTKEEDAQLRIAVETYGESDWQSVASTLEGRTGPQCSNRWKKTLHPDRKKSGRWTVDEDKHLKIAVKLFGPKNWTKIAQHVAGRTQVQCRERWVNCLDPSLNWSKWTEEEDLRLKAAIEEHGYWWSKVAERVPGRTDNQCLRRWKVLAPHEVPLLQAARRIKRSALLGNFVDRESERPALGPNDFIPLRMIAQSSEPENVNQYGKPKRKSRSLESHKKRDTIPGNVLKKIRSKRCTKRVQISRSSPLTIAGENLTTSGKNSINCKRRPHKLQSRRNVQGKSAVIDNDPAFIDSLLDSDLLMRTRVEGDEMLDQPDASGNEMLLSQLTRSSREGPTPCRQVSCRKTRPSGKSSSKKALRTMDMDESDMTLASFLQNKRKRRKLDVMESADQGCFSSMSSESNLRLNNIKVAEATSRASSLRKGGVTSATGPCPEMANESFRFNEERDHWTDDMTLASLVGKRTKKRCPVTANSGTLPLMEDVVACGTVAQLETSMESIQVNQEGDLGTDDIPLASLVRKKLKRRMRTTDSGPDPASST